MSTTALDAPAAAVPRDRRWPKVPTWSPAVVVLVAGALAQLGAQELWVDEAFSLAATRDLSETVARTGGTMSLYYAVLTPWSAVSTDPAWLRLLSLCFMAGALVVFSLVVERVAGRRAATIATLVAACSYLPARYAVEARSYALVALCVALSWYSLDRFVSQPESRWRWVHLATVLVIPFAHGLAALQVGVQLLAVVASRQPRPVLRHQLVATTTTAAVIAGLAVAGLGEVGDWLAPLSRQNLAIFGQEMLHPLPPVALLVAVLAMVGIASTVPGSWSARRPTERFRGVLLSCWGPASVVALLAVSVVRPSQLGRYGLSAVFGIAGLVGIAVDRLAHRYVRGAGTAAMVAILCLLLLTSHAAIGGDPQPWTRSVAEISARFEPGDAVLFRDAEVRLPWESAWMADREPAVAVLEPAPPLGHLERFSATPTVTELLDGTRSGDRIWYVDQYLPHATNREPGAMADPDFTSQITEVGTWEFDNVSVTLLEVR